MLRELSIQSLERGSATDLVVARVAYGDAASRVKQAVRLLLAHDGALVGIDARDGSGVGSVAMLGPHEDVASVREARATLVHDGDGALLAIELTVPGLVAGPSRYLRGG